MSNIKNNDNSSLFKSAVKINPDTKRHLILSIIGRNELTFDQISSQLSDFYFLSGRPNIKGVLNLLMGYDKSGKNYIDATNSPLVAKTDDEPPRYQLTRHGLEFIKSSAAGGHDYDSSFAKSEIIKDLNDATGYVTNDSGDRTLVKNYGEFENKHDDREILSLLSNTKIPDVWISIVANTSDVALLRWAWGHYPRTSRQIEQAFLHNKAMPAELVAERGHDNMTEEEVDEQSDEQPEPKKRPSNKSNKFIQRVDRAINSNKFTASQTNIINDILQIQYRLDGVGEESKSKILHSEMRQIRKIKYRISDINSALSLATLVHVFNDKNLHPALKSVLYSGVIGSIDTMLYSGNEKLVKEDDKDKFNYVLIIMKDILDNVVPEVFNTDYFEIGSTFTDGYVKTKLVNAIDIATNDDNPWRNDTVLSLTDYFTMDDDLAYKALANAGMLHNREILDGILAKKNYNLPFHGATGAIRAKMDVDGFDDISKILRAMERNDLYYNVANFMDIAMVSGGDVPIELVKELISRVDSSSIPDLDSETASKNGISGVIHSMIYKNTDIDDALETSEMIFDESRLGKNINLQEERNNFSNLVKSRFTTQEFTDSAYDYGNIGASFSDEDMLALKGSNDGKQKGVLESIHDFLYGRDKTKATGYIYGKINSDKAMHKVVDDVLKPRKVKKGEKTDVTLQDLIDLNTSLYKSGKIDDEAFNGLGMGLVNRVSEMGFVPLDDEYVNYVLKKISNVAGYDVKINKTVVYPTFDEINNNIDKRHDNAEITDDSYEFIKSIIAKYMEEINNKHKDDDFGYVRLNEHMVKRIFRDTIDGSGEYISLKSDFIPYVLGENSTENINMTIENMTDTDDVTIKDIEDIYQSLTNLSYNEERFVGKFRPFPASTVVYEKNDLINMCLLRDDTEHANGFKATIMSRLNDKEIPDRAGDDKKFDYEKFFTGNRQLGFLSFFPHVESDGKKALVVSCMDFELLNKAIVAEERPKKNEDLDTSLGIIGSQYIETKKYSDALGLMNKYDNYEDFFENYHSGIINFIKANFSDDAIIANTFSNSSISVALKEAIRYISTPEFSNRLRNGPRSEDASSLIGQGAAEIAKFEKDMHINENLEHLFAIPDRDDLHAKLVDFRKSYESIIGLWGSLDGNERKSGLIDILNKMLEFADDSSKMVYASLLNGLSKSDNEFLNLFKDWDKMLLNLLVRKAMDIGADEIWMPSKNTIAELVDKDAYTYDKFCPIYMRLDDRTSHEGKEIYHNKDMSYGILSKRFDNNALRLMGEDRESIYGPGKKYRPQYYNFITNNDLSDEDSSIREKIGLSFDDNSNLLRNAGTIEVNRLLQVFTGDENIVNAINMYRDNFSSTKVDVLPVQNEVNNAEFKVMNSNDLLDVFSKYFDDSVVNQIRERMEATKGNPLDFIVLDNGQYITTKRLLNETKASPKIQSMITRIADELKSTALDNVNLDDNGRIEVRVIKDMFKKDQTVTNVINNYLASVAFHPVNDMLKDIDAYGGAMPLTEVRGRLLEFDDETAQHGRYTGLFDKWVTSKSIKKPSDIPDSMSMDEINNLNLSKDVYDKIKKYITFKHGGQVTTLNKEDILNIKSLVGDVFSFSNVDNSTSESLDKSDLLDLRRVLPSTFKHHIDANDLRIMTSRLPRGTNKETWDENDLYHLKMSIMSEFPDYKKTYWSADDVSLLGRDIKQTGKDELDYNDLLSIQELLPPEYNPITFMDSVEPINIAPYSKIASSEVVTGHFYRIPVKDIPRTEIASTNKLVKVG